MFEKSRNHLSNKNLFLFIIDMKKLLRITLPFVLLSCSLYVKSQDFIHNAQVSGTFQADANAYVNDKLLHINDSTLNGKILGINGFALIHYDYKNFSAGLRYEAFLPPLLGFSPDAEGSGIANWFVNYKVDNFEVTAGNFYEQFGSGMILRSYEEWTLGYDNALDGFRVKFKPYHGIYLKGLMGYQRNYWVKYSEGNRGLVRGIDGELNFNELIEKLGNSPFRLSLEASFVSKYEKMPLKTIIRPILPEGSYEVYQYKLPENVGVWLAAINLGYSNWNLMTEYVRKSENPSALNNYIYREGQALLSVLTYSKKGLGIELSAKRIDNMGFKSRMEEKENVLDINFLPPLNPLHLYSFATMYPYATQPNGEMAVHTGIEYTFPKNTLLGGKYGTNLSLSYSLIKDIEKQPVSADIPIDSTGTLGYTSDFFAFGDRKFYEDLKIQLTKKFSQRLKMIAAYFNQVYDKDVIEGHTNEYGKVYANIGVVDMTYRINNQHSIRLELQTLFTEQDKGNWMGTTIEYTLAPKWFFSLMDEYNYGNDNPDDRIHYYNISFGYTHQSTRISLSYGRQREGLLCVGGICRYVPAYTGFGLTLSSNF